MRKEGINTTLMSNTSDGLMNTNVASQLVQPSWLVFYGACFTLTIKSVRIIHCRDVRLVLVSTKMEICLSTIHFESPSSTHLEALNKHPRWCHVWHAHSSAFFARDNRFKPRQLSFTERCCHAKWFFQNSFLSSGWTFFWRPVCRENGFFSTGEYGSREPHRHFILQQMNIVLRQVTIIPTSFGRKKEIGPKVWIFLNKRIGKSWGMTFILQQMNIILQKPFIFMKLQYVSKCWDPVSILRNPVS